MDVPSELGELQNITKLLEAPERENINCHKAVLYLANIISYETLVADPRNQQNTDFTFRQRALAISHKPFVVVQDSRALLYLVEQTMHEGTLYIGQILDSSSKELAHSYILFRNSEGAFMGIDKAGFKNDFSLYEVTDLLNFENYQRQEWRFVPLHEAREY